MFKDNFMDQDFETVFLPTDAIYDIKTPISSVALLPKYQKIIKRISTVTDITTLKDIVEIDIDNFSKLPYFGNLFMYQLVQLQNAIFHITKYSRPKTEEKLSKIKLSQEQLEIPLNQLNLSLKSQKLIKRISGLMEAVRTVQEVININPIDFSMLPTIGKSYVKDLIELQHELPIILEERTKNQYSFSHYSIEFNQIDAALIENVENYLWTLDEKRMDIALSRWGFNY